jgi:transcriptional regulator with XRE-family HTH domain
VSVPWTYGPTVCSMRDVARLDPIVAGFGAALKRERLRTGLSQEALAAKAEVDRTQVSSLERGVQEPLLSTVLKLCRAMGVKPGRLLNELDG